MTATAGSAGTYRSRRTWTLFAAAALVVVVVGLVLAFGVNRPPALDDLTTAPDPVPPGRVAWTEWDGDGECLRVVDGTGEVADVRCDGTIADGELAGWSDGAIVVRPWAEDIEERLVDPATGDVTTRPQQPDVIDESGPATDLRTERRDGRLEVHVDGRLVWATPADETYEVREAHVSADGTTVLLVDAADRLLLVPSDGSSSPRIWASDVPAHAPLVWEAAAARG